MALLTALVLVFKLVSREYGCRSRRARAKLVILGCVVGGLGKLVWILEREWQEW